jgi:hypothetical protein
VLYQGVVPILILGTTQEEGVLVDAERIKEIAR